MNGLAGGFFPVGASTDPLLSSFALPVPNNPVAAVIAAMDFNRLRLSIGHSSTASIQQRKNAVHDLGGHGGATSE
jgi:hypothetical protein